MRMLLLPLVVLAWSTGPISSPKSVPSVPAAPLEITAVPDPVDADALHRQAAGALDRLRQTRERRLAMAASAAL